VIRYLCHHEQRPGCRSDQSNDRVSGQVNIAPLPLTLEDAGGDVTVALKTRIFWCDIDTPGRFISELLRLCRC